MQTCFSPPEEEDEDGDWRVQLWVLVADVVLDSHVAAGGPSQLVLLPVDQLASVLLALALALALALVV